MDGSVGETLKEARLRREIDLPEVEASTKIRARFLRAIERDEWDRLPGEAYARSFIRTYGDYLGLDGAALAERQRRSTGAMRPVEALPRAEPTSLRAPAPAERRIHPGRLLAAGLAIALVVGLAVVALTSGGGGGRRSTGDSAQPADGESATAPASSGAPVKRRRSPGLSLRLSATAEVWVCLIDAAGQELVDGRILGPGAVEGPYRSDSFTVSLGNGEVTMTVDGQQASIPETSSPIGFTIGRGGTMRELSEGERPTCT